MATPCGGLPVTPGQLGGYTVRVTVRLMEDRAMTAACDADGQATGLDPRLEAEDADLPRRPVSDSPPVRRLRRMDDPEVLERVLAGLLNLP